MTTIIAVETDKGVTIGYDAKTTGGDQIELEQPKVFTNNGVTYGVAGTALFLNELRYGDLPAAPSDNVDAWITRELTPAIRAIAENALKPNEGGEYEAQIIVVANGRAYEISGNLGWVRSTDRTYFIGSGAAFAMGAHSAGASVSEALAIAAKHDPYTGYSLSTIEVAAGKN